MKHATNGRHLILISIALFSLVQFLRITAKPWEIPPPFPLVQTPCQEEWAHHWRRKINCCGKEETWWRHLQMACARGHGLSGWKHCRCIQLTESAVNGEWIYIIRCSNWINLWFLTGSQVWPTGFWEAVGWVGHSLWPALWWSWEAQMLMCAWLPVPRCSHPSPGCLKATHHEARRRDIWGYIQRIWLR